MGKSKRLKQFIAYLLTFCMMLSGLSVVSMGTVQAAEGDGTTTVYFYNSEGWTTVYAHAWDTDGDILGENPGWPGAQMQASTVGTNWWEISVPRDVANGETFNIIFNTGNGTQTKNVYIEDTINVYANVKGEKFATPDAAVKALEDNENEGVTETESTTIYFLNEDNLTDVHVHAWNSGNDNLLGTWPGTNAVAAENVGNGNWLKVDVPATGEFSIIVSYGDDPDNNKAIGGRSVADGKVYITTTCGNFDSPEAAEKAVDAIKNPTGSTTVYFYNNHNWATVSAHAYYNSGGTDINVFGDWPGKTAEDLGEGWWSVDIPRDAVTEPFRVIFNNGGAGKQTKSSYEITNYTNVYTNANGETPYASKEAAVEDATEPPEDYTTIQNGELTLYFYNNANWANVYAYSYDGDSYVPGGEAWPGALAEKATDMGDDWWKVTVKAKSLFSIIFHDNTGNRVERAVSSTKDIYFSATGMVYQSPKELEIALGVGATDENSTTVYFKKNSDWGNIYGYVYINDAPYGASWPGVPATDASEELESKDWWKIIVPKVATEEDGFNVIFTDSMAQTDGILIDNQEGVYIIPDSQVFNNVADADIEAAKYTPLFDREDPNEDLENYDVTLDGVGASLPYTTYEAETAVTTATVLEKNTEYLTMQSEASGRQAVKLEETGDYVEFTLDKEANAFVLRYSMPDNADGTGVNASLSMYVDEEETDLALTSKYAWIYGDYPYVNNPTTVSTGSNKVEAHRFFDETRGLFGKTLPAGTKIKLQKNAEDTAEYYVIDFIECEMVDAPGTQPDNSLSITDEAFGAVANDELDDAEAIKKCIAAAKAEEKEVWIPEGTFIVKEKTAFVVDGVTIRGAGMWYSNLEGAGASFHYKGISKFYDFAMTGVSDIRKDAEDLAGFEGKGAALNVTIQNIWMEHMKVGVWSYNTKHLVIQGCRIRNTYADAINLSSRTVDSVVRNNSIRNTGDDGIACWPNTYNSTGNTIEYNTVQIPTLANGIIVYGGGDNKVEYNYVADTVVNGSGIGVGSEFSTSDGFTGPITIANNELYRCGSYHKDRKYPVGAIWVWASNGPMTTKYDITNNSLYDCSEEAFLLDCWSNLSGVTLKDNNVYGATDGILVRGNEENSTVIGSATVENIVVKDYTGELVVNKNPEFFTIITSGKGIYEYVPITEIGLDETSLTLEVNGSFKLTATVNPSNATEDKTVTWTTSNPAIATVEDGTVTAVAPGKATITAKAGNQTATCEVTVNAKKDETPKDETPKDETVAVTEVKLDANTAELEIGATKKLVATVLPDNATAKTVTWTTSDDKIATVATDGTVTAVAPGKATITAKAGDKTATCEVTVNAKKGETPKDETVAVTEVKLDAIAELEIGATKKLVATVAPENATNKTVTWTTSDAAIATVAEDGTVTAVAPGKVTITAKAGDKTATCEVTVKYADLKSVKVTPTSAKIAVGKSVQMNVTANTENAKIAGVKWSVNNSKYAKVSSKGKVTTYSKGKGKTVKVTATVTDTNGNVVKKTVNVKIMNDKVTKVTISGKSTISVKYSKKSVQLKTTVKTNGKNANKTLKWTSSNTKYATVNSKGKVTFKAAGKGKTVTITATSTDGTNKKDKVKIKINK